MGAQFFEGQRDQIEKGKQWLLLSWLPGNSCWGSNPDWKARTGVTTVWIKTLLHDKKGRNMLTMELFYIVLEFPDSHVTQTENCPSLNRSQTEIFSFHVKATISFNRYMQLSLQRTSATVEITLNITPPSLFSSSPYMLKIHFLSYPDGRPHFCSPAVQYSHNAVTLVQQRQALLNTTAHIKRYCL